MKGYTDLEQSKKLAKILSLESADMRYAPFGDTHPWLWNEEVKLLEKDSVPCWSLAALVDVLPLEVETHKQTDGHKIYYYLESYMQRMGKEIYLSTKRHDNPVDACVEMILKLKEEEKL